METRLYSKRKFTFFPVPFVKGLLCAFFTIVFIIVFLFIEHSSMSVKYFFFFLSERAKSFFCMLKREQSSMYWAIEKSKQTSTNNSWTCSSKWGHMNTHTFCAHFVTFVFLSEHNVFLHTWNPNAYLQLMVHVTVSRWMSRSHWNTLRLFSCCIYFIHLSFRRRLQAVGASHLFFPPQSSFNANYTVRTWSHLLMRSGFST